MTVLFVPFAIRAQKDDFLGLCLGGQDLYCVMHSMYGDHMMRGCLSWHGNDSLGQVGQIWANVTHFQLQTASLLGTALQALLDLLTKGQKSKINVGL